MKAKRLPRLWCAMQGLLPVESCLWAQRGELAWPAGDEAIVPAGQAEARSRMKGGARERPRDFGAARPAAK